MNISVASSGLNNISVSFNSNPLPSTPYHRDHNDSRGATVILVIIITPSNTLCEVKEKCVNAASTIQLCPHDVRGRVSL